MDDMMDPRMRGATSALDKLGGFAADLRKKRFNSKMSPPTTVTISVEGGEPEGAKEPGDGPQEDDMEKLKQLYGDLG